MLRYAPTPDVPAGDHSPDCADCAPPVERDVPRRARPGWKRRFLASLRDHGIVGAACKAAGVSRSGYLYARRRDPKFDRAIWDAFADASDRLLEEAHRRALDHSDRLLIFLIERFDRREAQRPSMQDLRGRRTVREDVEEIARMLARFAQPAPKHVEALPGPQPPPACEPC